MSATRNDRHRVAMAITQTAALCEKESVSTRDCVPLLDDLYREYLTLPAPGHRYYRVGPAADSNRDRKKRETDEAIQGYKTLKTVLRQQIPE